jgi:hypothetical protein
LKKESTPPQPVVGEEASRKYLRDNMVNPPDETGKKETGNVEVTFSVNARGRPYRIRVEKGFSKVTNKEAIRLISEGPAWTTSDQKATITIKF